MTKSASEQNAITAHSGPAVTEPDPPAERPESSQSPQRHALIEQAAYFIALDRGFEPGGELDDWLEAEWKVDQRLAITQH